MKNIYSNIYKPNLINLKKAKKNIENNNFIGMPTETVYGLAGNAYSNISVAKIFKLKNIPADISSKSIKDAQREIKEIILKLENTETDLESSMEQYNRMMYLNFHIQEQFKKKADEIKQYTLDKNGKISSKDLK